MDQKEHQKIVLLLNEGKDTVEVSKIIPRAHRTVQRFVNVEKTQRKPHVGGRPKAITLNQMKKIKSNLAAKC